MLPSSSQLRNALAYVAITLLALLFLNLYSARNTRTLMFQAKYTAAQDKLQPIVSAFSGLDALTVENVEQVISVLGDLNVTRVIVTDYEARALYDSSVGQNCVGRYVLFEEVAQALGGNDVFYCVYDSGALESRAAMPVQTDGATIGCVYMMEYDTAQGKIIADLERTFLRGSVILEAAIVLASVCFSIISSGRMRKILTSVRLAREGEYNYKIRMRGADEFSKLAAEFNKLTERLQASESAQRQFISDASHELKTPLASIKLLSDSILQNDMDTATMREFVADIGSESDRLTRMAQKLLVLNRTEHAVELEHEVVDAEEVVSHVFRMLIPLAARREIDLTADLEHGCLILSAEDDLYQILFNLVENGIKYNRDGGSVHVKLRRTDDDVTITVEDTGAGIPHEALGHIFERFYRVDKARSRQAGGSGLGLSIVRELVARNLGTIDVNSIEGSGTRFTVVLPYFDMEREEGHDEEP